MRISREPLKESKLIVEKVPNNLHTTNPPVITGSKNIVSIETTFDKLLSNNNIQVELTKSSLLSF